MCGRYTTAGQPAEFDARFDASAAELGSSLGRYNVAPRQQVGVVERAQDRGLTGLTARRGHLPRWARTSKDRLQPINARNDKLLESKMWRPLLNAAAHRVLIPADGWYEWIKAEAKGEKPAPFHHRVDDGGWFAFAGLKNVTKVDDLDEPITTVTIVTTTANGPAARVHDRMPAVLAGREEELAWLNPDLGAEDAIELIQPLADDRVTLSPASKKVNAVKNQGEELLDPSVEVD
jgi:putative SOS response-associated peptidase YedK